MGLFTNKPGNAFENYIRDLEVKVALRRIQEEKDKRIAVAANWTGLYIYPGLRGEKKESV